MKKNCKKNYLLIEVFLAFSLIVLALFPLAKRPLLFFKKTLQTIEKSECEILAEETFHEIKKTLIENKIPFKELSKNQTYQMEPVDLFFQKPLKRSFSIGIRSKKEGKEFIYYYLSVIIYLSLDKQTYHYPYRLFLKKRQFK